MIPLEYSGTEHAARSVFPSLREVEGASQQTLSDSLLRHRIIHQLRDTVFVVTNISFAFFYLWLQFYFRRQLATIVTTQEPKSNSQPSVISCALQSFDWLQTYLHIALTTKCGLLFIVVLYWLEHKKLGSPASRSLHSPNGSRRGGAGIQYAAYLLEWVLLPVGFGVKLFWQLCGSVIFLNTRLCGKPENQHTYQRRFVELEQVTETASLSTLLPQELLQQTARFLREVQICWWVSLCVDIFCTVIIFFVMGSCYRARSATTVQRSVNASSAREVNNRQRLQLFQEAFVARRQTPTNVGNLIAEFRHQTRSHPRNNLLGGDALVSAPAPSSSRGINYNMVCPLCYNRTTGVRLPGCLFAASPSDSSVCCSNRGCPCYYIPYNAASLNHGVSCTNLPANRSAMQSNSNRTTEFAPARLRNESESGVFNNEAFSRRELQTLMLLMLRTTPVSVRNRIENFSCPSLSYRDVQRLPCYRYTTLVQQIRRKRQKMAISVHEEECTHCVNDTPQTPAEEAADGCVGAHPNFTVYVQENRSLEQLVCTTPREQEISSTLLGVHDANRSAIFLEEDNTSPVSQNKSILPEIAKENNVSLSTVTSVPSTSVSSQQTRNVHRGNTSQTPLLPRVHYSLNPPSNIGVTSVNEGCILGETTPTSTGGLNEIQNTLNPKDHENVCQAFISNPHEEENTIDHNPDAAESERCERRSSLSSFSSFQSFRLENTLDSRAPNPEMWEQGDNTAHNATNSASALEIEEVSSGTPSCSTVTSTPIPQAALSPHRNSTAALLNREAMEWPYYLLLYPNLCLFVITCFDALTTLTDLVHISGCCTSLLTASQRPANEAEVVASVVNRCISWNTQYHSRRADRLYTCALAWVRNAVKCLRRKIMGLAKTSRCSPGMRSGSLQRFANANNTVAETETIEDILPDAVAEETLNCCICCNNYGPQDTVVVLPCGSGHYFHRDCAQAWLVRHPTCPLCRAFISI